MKKYLIITIMLASGLAICLFAPAVFRLIGAFCVGAGCYAVVEVLRFARIEQEIQRYEHPEVEPEIAEPEAILPYSEPVVTYQLPGRLTREPAVRAAA